MQHMTLRKALERYGTLESERLGERKDGRVYYGLFRVRVGDSVVLWATDPRNTNVKWVTVDDRRCGCSLKAVLTVLPPVQFVRLIDSVRARIYDHFTCGKNGNEKARVLLHPDGCLMPASARPSGPGWGSCSTCWKTRIPARCSTGCPTRTH